MLVALNLFQAVGFYGFTNWAPTFIEHQGVKVTSSLAYSFVIAIANPIGPLLWMPIVERFERKWLVVAACFGTGALGLAVAATRLPAALIAQRDRDQLLQQPAVALLSRLPGRALPHPGAGDGDRLRLLLEPALDRGLQLCDRLPARPRRRAGRLRFHMLAAMLRGGSAPPRRCVVVMIAVSLFGPPTRGRALEEIAH